jgi:hypothetical protein
MDQRYPSPIGESPPYEPIPGLSSVPPPPLMRSVATDDAFTPTSVRGPTGTKGSPSKRPLLIGVGVALLFVAGAFFALRGGGGSAEKSEVLPPQPAVAGLPSSVEATVRMQAESSRRTAMQALMGSVGVSGTEAKLDRLNAEHSNLEWVGPTADSAESTVVSFDSQQGVMTIAVGATNKMCAFGRWAPPNPPEYVSMSHVEHCRAAGAPDAGWSVEPGGAAFDLPDENL